MNKKASSDAFLFSHFHAPPNRVIYYLKHFRAKITPINIKQQVFKGNDQN